MFNLVCSRRSIISALGAVAFAKPSVAAPKVDLALVLAIDCSFSVDQDEFHLQMRGYGEAFLHSPLVELIAAGGGRKIALAAFHWSDIGLEQVILPWSILASKADASEIANAFFTAKRVLPMGMTATGDALLFSQKLLGEGPSAFRQVVDISTDGKTNIGPRVTDARDQLVAQNITINGLAIANAEYDLVKFVEENVIGGVASFVMKADNYQVFGIAIREKLLKEITNALAA
jgi:hypothetical protein